MQTLERQGIVRQVSAGAMPLGADPWSAETDVLPTEGLRAPLVAHWAVTYRCNLACPFCYSESGPLRDAGPEPEVRLRIVERLAAWGILEVALGGGEPTVLPDFPELLAAIRSAGMVPNVTTNGTVQHEAVLNALAEQAGVVHLSADRPDLLDAARGPGVFARLRETARRLRGRGVRLGVNFLLTPDNLPHLADALTSLGELQVQQVTFLKPKGAWADRNWPGFPTEADRAILEAQLQVFLAIRPPLRCYVDTALRGEWADMGWLDDPEPEVLGCGGGQRHVAVTPEGDVYPCSHARRPAPVADHDPNGFVLLWSHWRDVRGSSRARCGHSAGDDSLQESSTLAHSQRYPDGTALAPLVRPVGLRDPAGTRPPSRLTQGGGSDLAGATSWADCDDTVERPRLVRTGRRLGIQLRELISIVSYQTFRRWVRETEAAHTAKDLAPKPNHERQETAAGRPGTGAAA